MTVNMPAYTQAAIKHFKWAICVWDR